MSPRPRAIALAVVVAAALASLAGAVNLAGAANAAGLLTVARHAAPAVAAAGTGHGSPTALWKFDEPSGASVLDSVGSLHGVVQGATRITHGFLGAALRFGGDGRVTIPSSPILHADVVIHSLWVRAPDGIAPTDGQVILEKGTVECGGNGYSVLVDGKYAAVRYRDFYVPAGPYLARPNQEIAVGTLWDGGWHHLMFVVNRLWSGETALSLWVDGWFIGGAGSSYPTVLFDDTAPLVLGGTDDGCGTGFVGDLDQVRVFDRGTPIEDLVVDEPVVPTSLTIDEIHPSEVDVTTLVDVTLLPAPTRPGWFRVYVTAEDGVERLVGGNEVTLGSLNTDGVYRTGYRSDYGGAASVRVAYVPDPPFLSSDAIGQSTIAKKPTTTRIGTQQVYIANEPIRIGVGVIAERPVQVTGFAELYERTSSGLVLVGSGELEDNDGTLVGGIEFWLPGKPAGTYEYEARYHGAPSYLPSESQPVEVTISPALEIGEPSINGGAATTDEPIVRVSTPATGAIALWLSNDPDDHRRFWMTGYVEEHDAWLTAPWYGDDADGVRTIWIRWADVLGRWSETKTASIVLDRGIPTGTVSIAGGASVAMSRDVTVSVPIADPSLVSDVQLSNDGKQWTTFPYATSIGWQLSAGDGTKTVHVRWRDLMGRASMTKSDGIVLDTVAPSVTTPVVRFGVGKTPTTTVPVRVSWTGSDAGTGVSRYEVQYRVDGGAWKAITTTTKATSLARSLTPGRTYQFRVRGIDGAGRASPWHGSSTLEAVRYQETSSRITYSGRWAKGSSSTYWGGTTRYASTAGKTASFQFAGRGVAWVAPVGPKRGAAKIYVNGTHVATVDLYAPTNGTSRIVFERHWSSSVKRTITVKVVGTSGHGRVDIDGFITLRSP